MPVDNLLGEEGSGFAIARRVSDRAASHHCMRALGVAERGARIDDAPILERSTFGATLAHPAASRTGSLNRVSKSTWPASTCSHRTPMDTEGNKAAATSFRASRSRSQGRRPRSSTAQSRSTAPRV